MSNSFVPLKGFHDRFDWSLIQHRFVVEHCNRLALLAQFHFCQLPIVEEWATFQKPFVITDLQQPNELFYVQTQHAKTAAPNWILRPELTTGLLRAYLANSHFNQKPTTLFTAGACFRYENPQKGRFRQFYQWNLEQLRCQWKDTRQTLAFLANLLNYFQLTKSIVIEVNYLTDHKLEQFNQFLQQLSDKIKNQLCDNCRQRLTKQGNSYRIFDCWQCQHHFVQKFSADAFLQAKEIQIFTKLRTWFQQLLPQAKIQINPTLVRGLAYYRGFVFEVKFQSANLPWAQNTLLAGGSYQLKTFFETPLTQTGEGFGFAIGIERFVIALNQIGFFKQLNNQFTNRKTVLIGYLSETNFLKAYHLQTELHQHNYIAQVAENTQHFPDLLTKALTLQVRYLIVFDAEYERSQKLLCKIMVAKNQPQKQFYLTWEGTLKLIYENYFPK